jgi:hypothetical protein
MGKITDGVNQINGAEKYVIYNFITIGSRRDNKKP